MWESEDEKKDVTSRVFTSIEAASILRSIPTTTFVPWDLTQRVTIPRGWYRMSCWCHRVQRGRQSCRAAAVVLRPGRPDTQVE